MSRLLTGTFCPPRGPVQGLTPARARPLVPNRIYPGGSVKIAQRGVIHSLRPVSLTAYLMIHQLELGKGDYGERHITGRPGWHNPVMFIARLE